MGSWDGGSDTFLHKGINGRWRDALSAEECTAYEQRTIDRLGGDCARWLETGRVTSG